MRNDLLQVELRQNEVESQKLKLNNGLSLVRLLLAQYCGLHDTAFSLIPDTDDVAMLPMKEDYEQALLGTAEYQLLDKQVEAAKLQRNIAVGQNLPSVAVGAGYNYHNLMENDRTFAMVYATVSVPISDWWGGSHAIKRKRIEYQKAHTTQHRASRREPPTESRLLPCWYNQDVRPARSPVALPAGSRQLYRCLRRLSE